MKPITLLITLFLLLLISCSHINTSNKTIQASGPDVTDTIQVSNFTEIESYQGIRVNYTLGSTVSVKYTAPESVKEHLEITCSGGQLTCKFKEGVIVNLKGREIIIDASAPKVNEFEAYSGSVINVTGDLNIDKLEATATSGATIKIPTVSATSADIETTSSGQVTISKLTTNSTELDASSGGSVNVSGTLGDVEAEASSGANVTISGSCNVLTSKASSWASINATQAKISTGNLIASSGASISVSQATGSAYQTSKSSGGSISIK